MKRLTELYVKGQSMLKDEKGQTMVEYGLLLTLVALILAAVLSTMELGIGRAFANITAKFPLS